MKNRIFISLAVILTFLLYRYSPFFYAYVIFGREQWLEMNSLVTASIVLLTGVMLALFCNYIINKKISFRELGLRGDFKKGLGIGLVSALPMIIGYAFLEPINSDFGIILVFRDLVQAGFGEEFLFRGFLFGMLFYYAGWGFIPAAAINGVFFGLGHLYQAGDPGTALGIFAFTFLAAAGFGWFYHAFNSLWMAIFLHGFMDLSWSLYNFDLNVMGSPLVNVFRGLTIALGIFFSIREAKRSGRYSLSGKVWRNSAGAEQ